MNDIKADPWGRIERMRVKYAALDDAAAQLVQALQLLHDETAEYQRINKLGGYDNHAMKFARSALTKYRESVK